MMARKLKVYGGLLVNHEAKPAPNGSSQVRTIIAAASKKEAAAILNRVVGNVTLHYLNGYWAETGNALELEVALAQPRKVFWSEDRYEKNYRLWKGQNN